MSTTETNRWLEGTYAPLREEVSAVDLPVEGTLPPELEGRYVRNGPNPLGAVDPATYHWFTGDGMVHGIRLRDGRAEWYRAKWVRSTSVSEALDEEPAPGERHGGMDGANTNVIGLDGRTFAIVEAGARPVELTYDLDTIEHSDLGGTLPNGYTAHPKVDPATGDLHAIAYHWALPHLQYIVIGPDAKVRQVEPVEVPGVADGPRLLHHRALDGRLRPTGHFQPRRGHGGRCVPLPVERDLRRPHRAPSLLAGSEQMCVGSMSNPAMCSIRSTPTTTEITSSST